MKKLLLLLLGIAFTLQGFSQRVSDLPTTTSVNDIDWLMMVQGAASRKISKGNLFQYHAPLANPTFTGTLTMPTPFILGATSVTTTGTRLNYLNAATGTTGTTSSNLVFSTSPTLVTPALGTPSAIILTNASGTAASLTAGAVTGFTPAGGSLTLSGADAVTLTTTAGTNVTLPTTGTLATTAITDLLAPIANPTFTGTVTLPLLKVTTGAAAGNILWSDAVGNLTYLGAGATTTMLVGGGAAAPVWTTATGTGAPVRAGDPTFTGVQKVSTTDTLATKAYARLVSGGALYDSVYIHYRVDSLAATKVNITDTAAMLGNYALSSETFSVDDAQDLAIIIPQQSDTIPQIVFGLGGGLTADTASFNDNAIIGQFFNKGSDTIFITSMMCILVEGTGTETVDVQVSWHATFKSGSATNLNAAAYTVTSITTGNEDTSFANSTIPPNVFVWCTISGVSAGNRPSYLGVTLSGYKRNLSY